MADLHRCLPQTKTPEALAAWIKENAIETKPHIQRIDLDEYVIAELQAKSSNASRAVDRLEKVKKDFNDILNNGTPTEGAESALEEPKHMPFDVTIPPTKGLKALRANREYADTQLENGYKEETTDVYLIPFPEESMIVGVTIEGEEFETGEYTREMSIEEVNQHKPLLKVDKKPKPAKEPKEKRNFMDDDQEVDL